MVPLQLAVALGTSLSVCLSVCLSVLVALCSESGGVQFSEPLQEHAERGAADS